MGKINVLSFAVANLIAAGEVVDRPASVIKELLENAIDSGADRVTVEIQHGGVTFMSVSDNGCGIEPDDLPVAIRRHATSKIKNADDLDGIMTLGFRGEALAAIAAVSHMRIISRVRGAKYGAMLEALGGEIVKLSERACSDGTTVIVEDLFANVPARRKFLKKDVTETMAVTATVEKIALSKPHIAFRLIVDGAVKLETVGDGNLKSAIYAVFGREFVSKLLPAEISSEGITVSGYIGRSDNVRPNRNYQNFFINGRYVRSKTASAAVEQAYTSYIPPEKFPCCVLYITVNPAAVDVNVHPAKLEVKFSNEKPVFEAVYYSVRSALEENVTRPDVVFTPSPKRISDLQTPIVDGRGESLKHRQLTAELYTSRGVQESTKPRDGFMRMTADEYVRTYTETKRVPEATAKQVAEDSDIKKSESENEVIINRIIDSVRNQEKTENSEVAVIHTEKPQKSESVIAGTDTDSGTDNEQVPINASGGFVGDTLDYRIVGEVFNTYVIVEKGDSLLLIDKHAAHERIIFERLKAGMNAGQHTASQLLMLPVEIMMTSDEVAALGDFRKEVEAVGFEFSTGKYTVNVSAVPEGVSPDAVSDMLVVMAERIRDNTGSVRLTRDIIFEKALYQASCKAAVKGGREYPPDYIKYIVSELMKIPDITFCPHGRPVAMELSHKKLDHQFERS